MRRLLVRNQFAALAVSLTTVVALAWLGLSQLAWRQSQGRVDGELLHLRNQLEQRFGEMERLGEAVAGLWRSGELRVADGPGTWKRLHPLVQPYQDRLTGLNFVDPEGRGFGMTFLGRAWGGRTVAPRQGVWVSGPILGDPENLVRRDPVRSRTAMDFRTREWYRLGATAQGGTWTEPYAFVGVLGGRPGISYVLPIRGGDRYLGVLSFDLLLETLTHTLQDARPTTGSFLVILDARHRVIARTPGGSKGDFLMPVDQFFPAGKTTSPSTWQPGTAVTFQKDGRVHHGSVGLFHRSGGLAWKLFLALPRSDVAVLAFQHTSLVAGLSLALLGFFVWQWRVLAQRVSTPLSQLARNARALGLGEAPVPVLSGITELQSLSQALTEAHQSLRDREHLQDQLRQAQKLETVGTLAGGIAHDVNNQLTAILGQLELGLERAEPGHPTRRSMERASEAARRCAETTRALLAFSRPSQPELLPLELNGVVQEAMILLDRAIRGHVALRPDLTPGLPPIMGDRVQLEQILINLVLNARDALPAGGTIVVGTRLNEDRLVELFVQDNGVGMTPEIQGRIFEPFFTTKGPGTGTGLGLSMVKGLVEAHQGRITVQTAWGRGTTFRVTFEPTFFSEPLPREDAEVRKGTLTGLDILVAEDEPLIQEALVEWLEEKGARVVTAEDGDAAWTAFQRQPFHVVISDHLMPGLTGLELLAHIRTLRPELPVILVSGRGLEGVQDRDPRLAILPKPYRMASLEALVRELAQTLP